MASLNSIINGTAPKPLDDEVILLFRAGGDNRLSTICQKTGLKRGAVPLIIEFNEAIILVSYLLVLMF